MELQEFITQSLKQINDGLIDGSKYISGYGGEGVHNSAYFTVNFDVAITSTSEESTGMGGKITVASIFQAGAKTETGKELNNSSRIQFAVQVHVKTD